MIRPTIPADTPILVAMTEKTRVFKPLEIAALQEVLDDFHAGTAGEDHRCITFEQSGQAIGFAYFAPVDMTDRSLAPMVDCRRSRSILAASAAS